MIILFTNSKSCEKEKKTENEMKRKRVLESANLEICILIQETWTLIQVHYWKAVSSQT